MIDDLEYRMPGELAGTILEQIMETKVREVAWAKRKWPAESVRSSLERAAQVRSLRAALLRAKPAVIAEIKKASPSGGVLRADFRPIEIAVEFERAGAAALSIVTEGKFFQGRLETVAQLRWKTHLPMLRKDFVVDPYQVLEARHAGADAVLLICALLDDALLGLLRSEVEALGMEALVEVHGQSELERALRSGAKLIGVNNRDLRTFEVSLQVSLDLAARLPEDVVAVAESGIRSAEDISRLSDAGYRGFLVGGQLMRAASPGAALAQLIPGQSGGRRRALQR